MRKTSCAACGTEFTVSSASGPLPKRCEPCRREYNRQQERQRARVLAEHRAERKVRCVDCGMSLPWVGTGRPRQRCTPCLAEWTRTQGATRYTRWRRANPERAREVDRRGYERRAEKIRASKLETHFQRTYGLTRAQLDQMAIDQNGQCLICRRTPDGNGGHARLHVDHDHATGKVRGLLCGNCNTMLGLANEDPAILLAAVEYLRRE